MFLKESQFSIMKAFANDITHFIVSDVAQPAPLSMSTLTMTDGGTTQTFPITEILTNNDLITASATLTEEMGNEHTWTEVGLVSSQNEIVDRIIVTTPAIKTPARIITWMFYFSFDHHLLADKVCP